jgi:HEPN superfamily RiboL-PSP-like protein
MPSARYKMLSQRLTELRRHLLPAKFDPTGSYPDRIHERARAFRLLIHAEFEAFIEDRVADILDARFAQWKQTRKTSRCLVSLAAYHEGVQIRNDPTSLLQPPQKASPLLEERMEKAKNSLRYYIKSQNNGVKEANLLRLLMPLGMESHEFDMTWLTTINSWATQRGEYAHKSWTKIQTLPDPYEELRMARLLLQGFKDLDQQLDNL